MPYLTARVEEDEGPLFLRKFGVPFWALARVFGGDPMYWYRMECGLGRCSVVGTTVRKAGLPEHLLADEHHQSLDGKKLYIATTVGSGCCLGAEPALAAGTDDLKTAYGTFKDEARDVAPKYAPKTVNTDGWKGTRAAWKALFKRVVILQCFLHGWLKIRDRAKHLGEVFAEVSRQVWDAYHAPDRRCFGHRLRRKPRSPRFVLVSFKVGFHTYRHSFASNLAAMGVDPRIVDLWMGHQTEAMRKRYLHLFPKDRKSVIESFSLAPKQE